jgi:RNA polymerase sigma-70 factor, ECF subfamily
MAAMHIAAIRAEPRDGDIHALLSGGAHADAFAELQRRYQGKVYRLCCALLRDRAQAEDAAQESLVRIWKALPSYDGRASLSTWIYTITRNRCLTAIGRRRELASLDAESELLDERERRDAEVPEDEQGQALLRELVEVLPERYRRVLTLFYYEDRSVSEVAEMLGVPEGTVKTNLFRARALLAAELKSRGLHDPQLWLGMSA